MANKQKITILRRWQVEAKTGLSRSTLYLFMDEGQFPRPITLGVRSVGWVESEIDSWLVDRIKNRDNKQEVT